MFEGLSLTTIVLFLPLVGFIILLFLNQETQKEQIKWTAFATTIVTFLASLVLWAGFDVNNPGLQMTHRFTWLNLQVGGATINSDYYVGVDGLSLLLVLLT